MPCQFDGHGGLIGRCLTGIVKRHGDGMLLRVQQEHGPPSFDILTYVVASFITHVHGHTGKDGRES